MEQTEGSETSAYKIQTLEKRPKERTQQRPSRLLARHEGMGGGNGVPFIRNRSTT